MPKWTVLLVALACALFPVAPAAVASPAPSTDRETSARDVPTRDEWLADVKAAMQGSRAYVRERAASGDKMLAINFDIDNTVIATYYDGGGAIPQMLRFSNLLKRKGVAMLFNTGRSADQRERTLDELRDAGYPVAKLCLRKAGEALAHGKQRCRSKFVKRGYTLIANIGNRDTDFEGGGYERAYRLPNYDGELG